MEKRITGMVATKTQNMKGKTRAMTGVMTMRTKNTKRKRRMVTRARLYTIPPHGDENPADPADQ
ncbi:hypothetical protein BGZ73_009154, partial [Actinomortierella ambigua]